MNADSSSFSRRELLIGGSFGLTALAGSALSTATAGAQHNLPPLERLVPARIGSWSQTSLGGLRIPLSETPEGEAYDQLLTRLYTSFGTMPIMLLIAYGETQSGSTRLHRPEDCYPSAGFELQRWQDVPVTPSVGKPLRARCLTATAPGRVEQILYWSRIGREFAMGSFDQRWAMLRQMTSGRIPDGVLVRISTINPNRARALPQLRAFATALLEVRSRPMDLLLRGYN